MWDYNVTVPKRFLQSTLVPFHEFHVLRPSCCLYDLAKTTKGLIVAIEPSAYCELRNEPMSIPLLIPMSGNAVICDAILALGNVSKNKHRATKYLEIYQAYEGIENNRKIDLSALRHWLSHNPKLLNRPSTVHALTKLFGTMDIDLEKTQHQRVFWRLYGELLIEIDSKLSPILQHRIKDFLMPKSYHRPTTRRLIEVEDYLARFHCHP
jgi:hypothetical protein